VITIELVTRKLLTCPQLIGDLEQVAFEQEQTLGERRNQLKELEASLLLQDNGPINGKNEQIRAAQLYERTAPERILVEIAEKEVARARLQLGVEKNAYKSWHAICGLMASLGLNEINYNTHDV
jgi:hypothetical protein